MSSVECDNSFLEGYCIYKILEINMSAFINAFKLFFRF